MLSLLVNEKEVRQLKAMIEEAGNIVCTAHVRPDGDAVGSMLGMCHLLRTMGKKAVALSPDQPPKSLNFLPGVKDLVCFSRYPDYTKVVLEEADLVICLDFNKASRQDNLAPLVQGASCRKVLIDHHLDPDCFTDLTISYPEMSSTCELVFRLVAALGWYEEMNLDAATCIATGLITDTRNFSVNCNNPEVYKILVALLEKGVDKHEIVRQALELRSLSSLRLQSYALSEKMDIIKGMKAAITTLDAADLQRFGYERGDTEGLVNMPLEIRGIVSSFYLRQDPDCVKVSARSVNRFPVNKICEDLFGGGGHLQAAGAEFFGPLEEAKRKIVEALPLYKDYLD